MHLTAIRHTPPVQQGICAGRSDFAVLDPHQWIDSVFFAPDMASVECIYSSPALRCSRFADLIAARLSLKIRIDPRLQEVNFGNWEGRSWTEIESLDHEEFHAWANNWQHAAPPNGESIADLERRIADFLGDIVQTPALLVTHAGPIRAMQVLCQSIAWNAVMSVAVPYATLIRIQWEPFAIGRGISTPSQVLV